ELVEFLHIPLIQATKYLAVRFPIVEFCDSFGQKSVLQRVKSCISPYAFLSSSSVIPLAKSPCCNALNRVAHVSFGPVSFFPLRRFAAIFFSLVDIVSNLLRHHHGRRYELKSGATRLQLQTQNGSFFFEAVARRSR